jgi:thioredoxin reductase (NADPH)
MKVYDVIVIGGGVSGSSAAMYSARFNLDVLVFAEEPGGLITTTHLVENYPGIKSIGGFEMGQTFMEHAQETGAKYNYARVDKIERIKDNDGQDRFRVESGGEEFVAKTVILATGTKHKHLGVPGEEEYANKGVSYCALCDGAFFRGGMACVVGGGDTAAIDAKILTQFVEKVYVLVRKDHMRAEPTNLKKLEKDEKVEIMYETEIESIEGDGEKVTHVVLKDGSELKLDAVFIAIGWNVKNELALQVGAEINDRGEVVIDRQARTNVPGFYAAGDVTDAEFKQAIIGAAEGVYAAVQAYEFIGDEEDRHIEN